MVENLKEISPKILLIIMIVSVFFIFPSAFEKIYNCGKDFGMSLANLFLSFFK